MQRQTGQDLAFIIGSPRSGTTWLQRMISAHPRVRTGQESHLFEWYLGPLLHTWQRTSQLGLRDNGRQGVGLAGYLTDEEFKAQLLGFVDAVTTAAGVVPGEMFLEKSPSHALFVDEISEVLPGSRFIHLIRDPRDVVTSLMAAADSWGSGWAPAKVRGAARVWQRHVVAATDAKSRLGDDRVIQVRYEDLFDDAPAQLHRVADFLRLDWDDDDIDAVVDANTASKLKTGGGTAIPVFGELRDKTGPEAREPDGFVRRASPGGGRESLTSLQLARLAELVGPTATEHGYIWDTDHRLKTAASVLESETLADVRRRARRALRG